MPGLWGRTSGDGGGECGGHEGGVGSGVVQKSSLKVACGEWGSFRFASRRLTAFTKARNAAAFISCSMIARVAMWWTWACSSRRRCIASTQKISRQINPRTFYFTLQPLLPSRKINRLMTSVRRGGWIWWTSNRGVSGIWSINKILMCNEILFLFIKNKGRF